MITISVFDYTVIVRNNNISAKARANSSSYIRLLESLLKRMTVEQINTILFTNRGKKYILYTDVCDCFIKLDVYDNYNTGESSKQCICGVHIETEYFIKNIVTNLTYKIGSTCIGHWNKTLIVQHKQDNQKKNDQEATFCENCGFKNNKKNAVVVLMIYRVWERNRK